MMPTIFQRLQLLHFHLLTTHKHIHIWCLSNDSVSKLFSCAFSVAHNSTFLEYKIENPKSEFLAYSMWGSYEFALRWTQTGGPSEFAEYFCGKGQLVAWLILTYLSCVLLLEAGGTVKSCHSHSTKFDALNWKTEKFSRQTPCLD